MLQKTAMKAVAIASLIALLVVLLPAQDVRSLIPPDARGANPLMTGVFVTPVPNAPFTATTVTQSTRRLQDGTTEVLKTSSNIARDAEGRIYNERRQTVPGSFTGTPPLLSGHIYDPVTRLNTFFNPAQRIARQSKLNGPAPDYQPTSGLPSAPAPLLNGEPLWRQEDLGTQVMEDVLVHGVRIIRTVPVSASGTGQPLVVTDEYWYSDDLHLNMLIKHSDPRTGEQTLTVTHVKRGDPAPQMFQVPADYKVVDETPGTTQD